MLRPVNLAQFLLERVNAANFIDSDACQCDRTHHRHAELHQVCHDNPPEPGERTVNAGDEQAPHDN